MKLPLHIRPDDRSPRACGMRAHHAFEMSQLNPQGFRQVTTKKGNRRTGKIYSSLPERRAYEAGLMD